jgi:hypothetical protein
VTQHRSGYLGTLFSVVLLLIGSFCVPALASPTSAAPGSILPVSVTQHPDHVALSWNDVSPTTITEWPVADIGGFHLPAHLISLRVTSSITNTDTLPIIEHLESIPWNGPLLAIEPPIPHTSEGEPRPGLAYISETESHMPSSPIIVLRSGWVQGQHIIVVAITPLFVQDGMVRLATTAQTRLPHTTLTTTMLPQETSSSGPETTEPEHLASTSSPHLANNTPNPLATAPAVKIQVARPGIQRITGSTLAAAGLDISTLTPTTIQVWHNGTEVALEEWGTEDGTLDEEDEIRFYAPAPGNRWNATDTYWLVHAAESTPPGNRMAQRTVTPGAATGESAPASPRTTALERGEWHNNTVYDSTLPGPDGDHWFAANLRTSLGQLPDLVTVIITPSLSLAEGPITLTVRGSAYTTSTHKLAVQMNTPLTTVAQEWKGIDDWEQTYELTQQPAASPGGMPWSFQLALLPGLAPDGVEPDSITWERPALLDFGGRGAAFRGVEGKWHYQLTNVPETASLYDVTDKQAPMRLVAPMDTTTAFDDGPAAHSYILAGPGTLHTPAAMPHTPVDLTTPMTATVLYIAPAELHAGLQPLLALRQQQGYHPAVVDVQAIYDTWSYGQVSPQAIRTFLRHAAATWNPPPIAVTFVGDGTADPLNYTGHNNPNLIPPYMAMVDPWLGETACETCYVQLDGDDPLSDVLPDMMVGRLPVKNAAELDHVISKIISYETGGISGAWRSRSIYIADNYRDTFGIADGAGDFTAFLEQSVELQPSSFTIERLYYDPSPSHTSEPWREPDAARAHQHTLALLNQGAALVNFAGHSHYWQMAVTDPSADISYLLGLYDVDTLTNAPGLPIFLQLTCLTGAFQQPARSGTTIDERLLLHPNGGAIATWGSSGLGVAYGHEWLQRGFYQTLWAHEGTKPTLGELTRSGYVELFTKGNCCLETIRTFALLGDPLTRPQVVGSSTSGTPGAGTVYLPLVLQ